MDFFWRCIRVVAGVVVDPSDNGNGEEEEAMVEGELDSCVGCW